MDQHEPFDRTSANDPRRAPTLSAREREVLEWLPTHLSNAEIGRQVHMSVNTVKSHLKAIYLALGVGSRSEAVAVAQTSGLLGDRCPWCARGSGAAIHAPGVDEAVRRRVS